MLKDEKDIEEETKKIKGQTIKGLLKMYSIFFILILYWVFLHPNNLVEKTSPSGEKEVIVKKYGRDLLKGGFVSIVIKEDGKTKRRKRVRVDNKTESNHSDRYSITWRDDENVVYVSMNFENSGKSLTYDYETSALKIDD